MSSIKYLNFKFYGLKLWIKNINFDQRVNNIQFEQILKSMLRTQRTCKPTIKFSNFTSNKMNRSSLKTFSLN